MIFVESDDDDDSALASVASAPEEFVVASVSLESDDAATAEGFAPDVKLHPGVKLECDLELEGSNSAESFPCFPVVRPETAEFFQGFSFVFTETDGFGCHVVCSPVGAQPQDGESLPSADQLDLVDNAFTVSAAATDTLEGNRCSPSAILMPVSRSRSASRAPFTGKTRARS